MTDRRTSTERLVVFTDAVFAVIITIMVLDLRPPAQARLSALLPLWPTALSYAVSYLFVAIILDQPSSSLAFCPRSHNKAYLVEFCTSVHDFTHTFFNCVDCRHKTRGRPSPCLCSCIRNGQYCVSGISTGDIVASA